MQRCKAFVLMMATATACVTVPAPPAGPIPVEVDQRVRVTLSSRVALGPLQGTVLLVSPDTLTVEREEGGLRKLSRNQIDRVEVSVEQERDAFGSAGNGLLAAAPFLALGGIALLFFPPDYKGAAFTFTLLTAGGAVMVGSFMGASTDQDVWVEASWPAFHAPADSLGTEDK